jgi:hypothetical protein
MGQSGRPRQTERGRLLGRLVVLQLHTTTLLPRLKNILFPIFRHRLIVSNIACILHPFHKYHEHLYRELHEGHLLVSFVLKYSVFFVFINDLKLKVKIIFEPSDWDKQNDYKIGLKMES